MTGVTITTDCCVVGGGPAGMMLAVLLARAGVETVVLEKHADFLRDFRGDTIHPSTLEILAELGWIADFLRLPLREVRDVGVDVSGVHIPVADFSHLPVRCLFVVLMPQQGFLARQGAAFRLRRRLEAPGLIMDEGRIAGVQAQEPDHTATVRAKLVVHTTIRSGRRPRCRGEGSPWCLFPLRGGDCTINPLDLTATLGSSHPDQLDATSDTARSHPGSRRPGPVFHAHERR